MRLTKLLWKSHLWKKHVNLLEVTPNALMQIIRKWIRKLTKLSINYSSLLPSLKIFDHVLFSLRKIDNYLVLQFCVNSVEWVKKISFEIISYFSSKIHIMTRYSPCPLRHSFNSSHQYTNIISKKLLLLSAS